MDVRYFRPQFHTALVPATPRPSAHQTMMPNAQMSVARLTWLEKPSCRCSAAAAAAAAGAGVSGGEHVRNNH